MQQFCQYGSVRGATGNRRPYRDSSFTLFSQTKSIENNHALTQYRTRITQ
jgi:hypothetical protein